MHWRFINRKEAIEKYKSMEDFRNSGPHFLIAMDGFLGKKIEREDVIETINRMKNKKSAFEEEMVFSYAGWKFLVSWITEIKEADNKEMEQLEFTFN